MNNRFIARRQEGMALIFVLLAILAILGAVTVVTIKVQSTALMTNKAVQSTLLDEACKAGADLAIERLWNQYVIGNGNTTGNLASYRVFINNLVPNNEDLNGNGSRDSDEADLNGDDSFDISEPISLQNLAGAGVTFPLALGSNNPNGQTPASISDVTITRTDDATGMVITIRSTAQAPSPSRRDPDAVVTRSMDQTIRVSGTPFSGFEFAVLANNINCILCHAEMRPLSLELNTDTTKYGTFDRIKVATLESLMFRTGSADSKIAGTIYTRGAVTNEAGTELSASTLASCTQLRSYQFSNSNGKVTQSSTGAMTATALKNATTDSDGMLTQFANLYKNYPTDSKLMTDGTVPEDFPAPFPDDNEDRYVQDDEFEQISRVADGSIAGGVAVGVAEGDYYTGTALPTSSNGALADLSDGTYEGNLILVGTTTNPILIDGKVVVDGDLVISGKVKGYGQLLVRGNTYITGDVTYADAAGSFGVATDGTENALAIVSGGSILMGDYLTIRGKNHTADTSKYPSTSYSILTRTSTKSTSVTTNSVTQTLKYGYFDPGVIDANGIVSTMLDASGNTVTRTGQQFSFTQSELMLFNIKEAEKAAEDSTYTPRFYGLRDTQPNNLFTYEKPPDEHAVRYDETGTGVRTLTNYLTYKGYSLDILNRAAYHYMNPSGNWISETTLRQIWWNDEQTRPSSGRPFSFDGLLYSNNAIFAITRSRTRHGSYTDGKMLVRGAIICPDIGVLVAGPDSSGCKSFQLLYDRRVRAFWALEDTTQVAFRRLVYAPAT